jgi:hypothetical protein
MAWCAGRGSKYNLNRAVTSVEALLDSCFNRLGRCFMKPGASLAFAILTSSRCGLTNFPQSSTQLLIIVEQSSELIAVIEDPHQPQHLIWWHRIVDLVVPQKVTKSFNEQELQNTFDDNLLEDTTSVVKVCPCVGVSLFGTGGRQRGRDYGISVCLCIELENDLIKSDIYKNVPGVSSILEPLSSISTLSASSKS